ncbi:enoyl-CoA hydratase-related protein [Actinopolyspora mortivallis]|uniref:enoyl-CoA hydratase-related protein n=1 Tax=Actinopolyspora mortivallis TaxID=33906 RepID=UPI0003814E33|nr:enoyl-CoA hydratase-related protein [Actinopolyspora mortivallis]
MANTDEVLAEHHDAVLLLTLNRPERLNAWTPTMRDRYCALLEEADRDPAVRSIVVTGAGNGFCAGSDITAPGVERSAPEGTSRGPNLSMRLGKPVITAINGTASGAGLAAALFTDIRFTSPETSLTTAFGRADLVAEHGVGWLLPKLVGIDRAMDLLLSARKVTGLQARSLGLVDRVVPRQKVLPSALEYARTLALEYSPAAMAEIKQRIYSGLETASELAAYAAHNRMMTVLRGNGDSRGRTGPGRYGARSSSRD